MSEVESKRGQVQEQLEELEKTTLVLGETVTRIEKRLVRVLRSASGIAMEDVAYVEPVELVPLAAHIRTLTSAVKDQVGRLCLILDLLEL